MEGTTAEGGYTTENEPQTVDIRNNYSDFAGKLTDIKVTQTDINA